MGRVVTFEPPDLPVEAGVLGLVAVPDRRLGVEEAGAGFARLTAGRGWPGIVGGRPKAWLSWAAGTAAFALNAALAWLAAAATSCWATLWL